MQESLNTGSVVMGTMKKKGKIFGRWKTYFVELQKKDLYIRKNQGDKKIRHHYTITPTTLINVCSSKKRNYIEIGIPNENIVRLQPKSGPSISEWIEALETAANDKSQLTAESFEFLSVIGRGFFGKVFLVEHRETGETFALKVVTKSLLASLGQTETILSESSILKQIEHPFIVNLRFAFQTASKFYLGMDYVPGGDMFGVIERNGKIPIEDVRIYAGEIALALDHLHSHGIIYRDLKPENVLIGVDGHTKLADFGLAKDISKEKETMTFCGTDAFMAPEIISGRPYSYSTDWWAFGVLIYQLIFGDTPFRGDSEQKLHMNIRYMDPKYPEGTDPSIINFLNGFLCKSPICRSTFAKVENHPFWNGQTRSDLLNKRRTPLFVPTLPTSVSTDYFDKSYTGMDVNDSDAEPMLGPENVFQGFSFIGEDISS